MKVLVIEDQYKEIEGLLDYMNFKFFNDTLEFENIKTSQELESKNLENFELFIIDIQLDFTSNKDGFLVARHLIEKNNDSKIIIITGARETVPPELMNVSLVYKPLDDEELSSEIKKLLN